MKIVFLNTWNGKIRDGIVRFLGEQARDTDIFCFQEAYDHMRCLIEEPLRDFDEVGAYKHMVGDDDFAPATYMRKSVPFRSSETILESERGLGLALSTEVDIGGLHLHICNVHGFSRRADDKLDDPARLAQSRDIIEFFKNKNGSKVIGGDFNILPEAKSIKMFEEHGYRDLIEEFNVSTTRNRLALGKYPGHELYFSDYVFVSPDVKLENFTVPNIEVSDHLPLILEIGV